MSERFTPDPEVLARWHSKLDAIVEALKAVKASLGETGALLVSVPQPVPK